MRFSSFTQPCIIFVRHFSTNDSSLPQFSRFILFSRVFPAVLTTQEEAQRLVVNRVNCEDILQRLPFVQYQRALVLIAKKLSATGGKYTIATSLSVN